MKKCGIVLWVVFGLLACDSNGKVGSKADSVKRDLDTTVQKLADSAKAKGERTFEKVKDKIEEIRIKKDSTDK